MSPSFFDRGASSFISGQLITEIKQVFDGLIQFRTVQQDAKPGILVHVIGREESILQPQRTNHDRVTLYIQDINDAIFIQAKLSSIDLQHNSIPLFAVQMTKNGIIIIPWIIRLCSILLPAPAE